MGEKVSVIIPVYNTEEYIDKCIQSILDQTYDNIEIILVNDGSTDMSGELCKKWSDEEPRVVYFDQMENKGVSSARNKGISMASGTYILFVDSDDRLKPTAIEEYVASIIKNYAQIVISECLPCEDKLSESSVYEKVVSVDDALAWVIAPEGLNGSACAKLFLSSIIRQHHLNFHPEIRYCEDMLFCYEYIRCTSVIVHLYKCLYECTYRETSTMRQGVTDINDKRLDIGKVFQMIIDEGECNKEYYQIAEARLVYQDCKILPSFLKFTGGKEVIKKLRKRIRPHICVFLRSGNVYPLKTRIKTMVKYLLPKIVYIKQAMNT